MKRLLVLGSPGSGKSTFARALGEALHLPVVHLDREYWQAGWVEPAPEVWAEKVARMAQEGRWIMDGNYGGTLDARLALADAVVFLDFPVPLCAWRIVKRWFSSRGVVRADMAPGCPEQLEREFLLYVLRFGRDKAPGLRAKLASFPGARFHVTRPADARLLVGEIARRAASEQD